MNYETATIELTLYSGRKILIVGQGEQSIAFYPGNAKTFECNAQQAYKEALSWWEMVGQHVIRKEITAYDPNLPTWSVYNVTVKLVKIIYYDGDEEDETHHAEWHLALSSSLHDIHEQLDDEAWDDWLDDFVFSPLQEHGFNYPRHIGVEGVPGQMFSTLHTDVSDNGLDVVVQLTYQRDV
jgi:hypothetical protein